MNRVTPMNREDNIQVLIDGKSVLYSKVHVICDDHGKPVLVEKSVPMMDKKKVHNVLKKRTEVRATEENKEIRVTEEADNHD